MNYPQPPKIVSDLPIKEKGWYVIMVSGLYEPHLYRVNLIEDGEYKTTQSADVNLRRPGDRRWLEQYVQELSKRIHIQGIYFGTDGCMGCNHYPLGKFIEQHSQWKSFDYLKDLHLDNLY